MMQAHKDPGPEKLAGESTFNLIDEPWLPIIDHRGVEREVSLREAILNAHVLRDVSGDLPTMRFALLRILLAICYRVLDRQIVEDPVEAWAELWKEEAFSPADFERYFTDWHDRFDLTDIERPFLQSPTLRTVKDEWKPISLFVADVETERPIFTMRSELPSLSLAAAARWLVHAHAYDYSGIKSGAVGDDRVNNGKGYPMGTGWAGWLGGIAVGGKNLRETILLNLICNRSAAVRRDAPVWEQGVPGPGVRSAEEIGTIGPVALMTWPQRRIRLLIEDGLATGVLVTNGDPIDYTVQSGTELMSGWRFSEPQSTKAKTPRYMPRKLDRGRALWRGLSTLLPNPSGADSPPAAKTKKKWDIQAISEPAAVIAWLGRLVHEGKVDRGHVIEISAVSMEYGTQNASFENIVSDRLAFASALADLTDGEGLLERAQNAVARAEGAVRALSRLAADINRAAGGEGDGAAAAAESDAYAVLDQSFRQWLLRLQPSCDGPALLRDWTEQVRSVVEERAQRIVEAAPPSAWSGRPSSVPGRVASVPTAMQSFGYALFQVLGKRPGVQNSTDIATEQNATTEVAQ